MQPTNSYNNQNGMGRNVGAPMYPDAVPQNQSNMYVSPQEPMYPPQPVKCFCGYLYRDGLYGLGSSVCHEYGDNPHRSRSQQ